MKKLFIIPFLLLMAWDATAQKKEKKKKDQASQAAVPTTLRPPQSDVPASGNPNLLPLFGGQSRTDAQKTRDDAFLADCDRNFSSRTEASKFFDARAWEYLQEGNADTAIYRFNLAWLLDNKNANVYWGLGAIQAAKAKDDEALVLLDKALALEPKNSALLTDVASLHLNKYKVKADKKSLQNSIAMLEKAIEADSTNATAYTKMSMAYFYQNDYDKAWDYLHKGRTFNLAGMDFAYLTELIAKKEDPQGLFK
jgi:tetratricopeptide (TPR) repeat protein